MIRNKLLLFGFLMMGTSAFAQIDFGINAGYNNSTVKTTMDGIAASVDGSGFFAGVMADFSFSDALQLQGSVNYVNVEESNFLQIPVLLKYYIGQSRFNLQAGPQASISLDEDYGLINNFGLDGVIGAGFDIDENFSLFARYSFELTNRTSKGIYHYDPYSYQEYYLDAKTKFNSLNIGVGYTF